MRSVKIYAGGDGRPKGDGLVVFVLEASVFGAVVVVVVLVVH